MTAYEQSELRRAGLQGVWYEKAKKMIEQGKPVNEVIKKIKAMRDKKLGWI